MYGPSQILMGMWDDLDGFNLGVESCVGQNRGCDCRRR